MVQGHAPPSAALGWLRSRFTNCLRWAAVLWNLPWKALCLPQAASLLGQAQLRVSRCQTTPAGSAVVPAGALESCSPAKSNMPAPPIWTPSQRHSRPWWSLKGRKPAMSSSLLPGQRRPQLGQLPLRQRRQQTSARRQRRQPPTCCSARRCAGSCAPAAAMAHLWDLLPWEMHLPAARKCSGSRHNHCCRRATMARGVPVRSLLTWYRGAHAMQVHVAGMKCIPRRLFLSLSLF